MCLQGEGALTVDQTGREEVGRAIDNLQARFFADNFGDGGHLAHMKEYEDDKGDSMESRDHEHSQLLVVKSAIANAYDAEFEALEMDSDPDVSDSKINQIISSFCLAQVESSRVIMLAILNWLKSWINVNLFIKNCSIPLYAFTQIYICS